jgi:hypothetical protein
LAQAAVLDLYQGTWAGTLSREETTDAFTDQAVFTHPGRGVDVYTEGKMNPAGSYMDMQWFSWNQLYPFIRSANTAIIKLAENEAGFDAATLNQLLGEAHYMRGYFYAQLMRQFGGVVLTETPFTLEDEASNPRATLAATVAFIIADLDKAITKLAGAPESKARASGITAMAMKARVLTHVASDLYDRSTASSVATIAAYADQDLINYASGQEGRWIAAKAASKAFLDVAPGYKLDLVAPATTNDAMQNYEDIWLQGDQNADYIWGRSVEEFGFNSRTYAGGSGWAQGPGMVAIYHGPNGYHEWAGTTPTESLVSKYAMADGTAFDWGNPAHAADPYVNREARFYASILFDRAPWKQRTSDVVKFDNFNQIQTGYYNFLPGNISGTEEVLKNGVDTRQGPIEDWNGSRTGYYFKKFHDPYAPASWPANLQKVDAPYIRVAEILLSYAEACYNTGDEGEAILWLNKLRYRNGLPGVTESGTALLELIKNERDVELANEDHRLFDMKRWLEGPASLNHQAQQVLITATQKAGSTMSPGTYKHSAVDFDYTFVPTDIVFENRVWKDHVYFMPIRQGEIDADPSLIQNPGYN